MSFPKTSPGSLKWSMNLLPRCSDQGKHGVNHAVCFRGDTRQASGGKVTLVQLSTGFISSLPLCLSLVVIFSGYFRYFFHYSLVKEKSYLPYDSLLMPLELQLLLGALCSPSCNDGLCALLKDILWV